MTALVGLKSYSLKTNGKDQNPNVSNSTALSEVLRNIQYFIIQHIAIIIVIFPRTPTLMPRYIGTEMPIQFLHSKMILPKALQLLQRFGTSVLF